MKRIIEKIGREAMRPIRYFGRVAMFFMVGVANLFVPPFQKDKVYDHIWFIGAKSINVIILTGIFIGMVLGLQGYYSLVQFGSEAALGTAVGLSIVRELGPVFTAMMITARAGSAMTAEIGVMRISEQIDALKTMQINPVRFVYTPRLLASVISFPLLTFIFDIVGIFGGFLSGSFLLGVNRYVYLERVIQGVQIHDIMGGFYKSVVFSIVVTTICCYRGYYTHLYTGFGARGVSLSTTNAVVRSCIYILVFDYIITFLMV